jgi:hypothetical protein
MPPVSSAAFQIRESEAGSMSDSNWFGDVNRDGRANWWDDLLAFWFFDTYTRQQRQLRQMAEELERRREQPLWDAPSRRRASTDADDDDDWDDDDDDRDDDVWDDDDEADLWVEDDDWDED